MPLRQRPADQAKAAIADDYSSLQPDLRPGRSRPLQATRAVEQIAALTLELLTAKLVMDRLEAAHTEPRGSNAPTKRVRTPMQMPGAGAGLSRGVTHGAAWPPLALIHALMAASPCAANTHWPAYPPSGTGSWLEGTRHAVPTPAACTPWPVSPERYDQPYLHTTSEPPGWGPW